MVKTPTVLVLGAGASCTVGYPVGHGLRGLLIGIRSRAVSETAGLHEHGADLKRFVAEFERSQLYSIDAFLARRPEFADIGKLAIATTLLGCEDERALISPIETDRWYQYLFNAIATESWDDLDFSNLTIVTFNYDRSLEHFLMFSLGAAFGRDTEEVVKKLETLKIIHCYGTLGPTLPSQSSYWQYGGKITPLRVSQAAKCIQVLPEGRDDSEAFIAARESLTAAHTIIFLGFGFDKMNLERLHSTKTCREELVTQNGQRLTRRVAATCFKLTNAEREAAQDATAGPTGGVMYLRQLPLGASAVHTFIDTDCITLLRSTRYLE